MGGKFICVEGLDGCGKTTQVKLLVRWLRSEGYEVLRTAEPTRGTLGRIIKRSLRRAGLRARVEALLFAADRLEHAESLIIPSLREGKIVVSERCVYSSLAYQSARGLPMEWIEGINVFAPLPDFAILIDVPPEMCVRRIRGRRKLDKFESDLELQRTVRMKYLELVRKGRLELVDGTGSVGDVHQQIRKLVEKIL